MPPTSPVRMPDLLLSTSETILAQLRANGAAVSVNALADLADTQTALSLEHASLPCAAGQSAFDAACLETGYVRLSRAARHACSLHRLHLTAPQRTHSLLKPHDRQEEENQGGKKLATPGSPAATFHCLGGRRSTRMRFEWVWCGRRSTGMRFEWVWCGRRSTRMRFAWVWCGRRSTRIRFEWVWCGRRSTRLRFEWFWCGRRSTRMRFKWFWCGCHTKPIQISSEYCACHTKPIQILSEYCHTKPIQISSEYCRHQTHSNLIRAPAKPNSSNLTQVLRLPHQTHANLIRVLRLPHQTHANLIRVLRLPHQTHSNLIRVLRLPHQTHSNLIRALRLPHQTHSSLIRVLRLPHQTHSNLMRVLRLPHQTHFKSHPSTVQISFEYCACHAKPTVDDEMADVDGDHARA